METSLLKDILLKQSSLSKLFQRNPQSLFEGSTLKNPGIIIAYLYKCSFCLTYCKGNFSKHPVVPEPGSPAYAWRR